MGRGERRKGERRYRYSVLSKVFFILLLIVDCTVRVHVLSLLELNTRGCGEWGRSEELRLDYLPRIHFTYVALYTKSP